MKKTYSIAFYCFLLVLSGINVALADTTTTSQSQQVTPVVNSSAKQEAPININSADKETLTKVKGISKKKAQAIVNYRNQNGPFKTLEDLLKVNCRGIHKKMVRESE